MENKFAAEPKLITNKNKYRSQKIDPSILERKYILKIQEKNKKQNIENQINLFKNKVYETPYDIKPLSKQKIPINLDFFLIENKGENIIKKEFGTQIDKIKDSKNPDILTSKKKEFLKKIEHLNKGKPIGQNDYIPKKTGIDVYTQVEHDELFDFDKEVNPIINIIITKTLEQSLLEIEEETEIERMKKFKEEYFQKKLNKDNKENKKLIESENLDLKKKNELLNKYNDTKKQIEDIQEKILINDISNNFLGNLTMDTINDLKDKSYYNINLYELVYNKTIPEIYDKIDEKINNKNKNLEDVKNLMPNFENILFKHNINYYDYLKKKRLIFNEKEFTILKYESIYLKIEYDDFPIDYFLYNLDKISNNEIDNFENEYITKYKEITNEISNTENIDDNKINSLINEALPNYYNNDLFRINEFDKIKVCFSNNLFKKLSPNEKIFNLNFAFYDNEHNLIDFIIDNKISDNLKNKIQKLELNFDYKENENYDIIFFIDLRKLKEEYEYFNIFVSTNNNKDLNLINKDLYNPLIKIFEHSTKKIIYQKGLNIDEILDNDIFKSYQNKDENLLLSFNNYINKDTNLQNEIVDKKEEEIKEKIEDNNKEEENTKNLNIINNNDIIDGLIENEEPFFKACYFLIKINLEEELFHSTKKLLFCNKFLEIIDIIGKLNKKYSFLFNFKSLGEKLINKTEFEFENNINKIIGPFNKEQIIDNLKDIIDLNLNEDDEFIFEIRGININNIPNYGDYLNKFKNINNYKIKVKSSKENIENEVINTGEENIEKENTESKNNENENK